MKVTYQLLLTVCVFPLMWSCSSRESEDKERVDQQNKERFERHDERREAQFVVDAIDISYAIIEVAQLGEQKATSPGLKGYAKKFVEGQISVINKLKTYAEDHDISVPFSGPSRTKGSVERLYQKEGVKFNEDWHNELEKLTKQLTNDLEKFQDKAEGPLRQVISTSLTTLRFHQYLLTEAEDNQLIDE